MVLGEYLRTGLLDLVALLENHKDKTYTIEINGNPNKKSFLRYLNGRYEFGSLIDGVFEVVDYMEGKVLHSGISSKTRLIKDYIEYTKEMIAADL